MYKNRIYRQIAADCTKAYWSSILFYALQLKSGCGRVFCKNAGCVLGRYLK